LYAGYQKGIWEKIELSKPSFIEMHQNLIPSIYVLVTSGFLLFVAVLMISIPMIRVLFISPHKEDCP
jgi:hypothetical protein|tara:strand:+ start:272 stop:472 length:201 start_codon:yes stop_codon:yes gene_type:complete